MNMAFEVQKYSEAVYTDFKGRLKQIYSAMDQAYNTAAGHYGFACAGCRDNCCQTRFYHHTAIEYIFMIEGLNTLTLEKQNEVKLRALSVVDQTARADDNAEAVRLMCPLNFDERCILYPYRPMICRLHGIPHELQKPGQNPVLVPGCETFDQQCGPKRDFKFDRTPFYREMAILEQEVKQALGFARKYKMTIAEMILDFHS
jgi:Fe-S-cluster containining protein